MAPDSNVAGEVVRKTVLIVEDNASLRHALCALFKRKAVLDVCGVAKNGNEALEVAGQLHPDLIVLDLLMPEMNGLDTAHALKRVLPTVPLILYSAFDDSLSEQAKLMGISEIVSKCDPILISAYARPVARNCCLRKRVHLFVAPLPDGCYTFFFAWMMPCTEGRIPNSHNILSHSSPRASNTESLFSRAQSSRRELLQNSKDKCGTSTGKLRVLPFLPKAETPNCANSLV